MAVHQKKVGIAAGRCFIVEQLESFPERAVDEMIASGMEAAKARRRRQDMRKTVLDRLY